MSGQGSDGSTSVGLWVPSSRTEVETGVYVLGPEDVREVEWCKSEVGGEEWFFLKVIVVNNSNIFSSVSSERILWFRKGF